jgi:hypothetical protein
MPHKNPKDKSAYMAQRYLKKAKEIKAYQKQYRVDHRAEITAKRRSYAREDYLIKRFVRKLSAVQYLGGSCVCCGCDDPAVLQFHHRDPNMKKFMVAQPLLSSRRCPYSADDLIKELDKCDLLCGNCHAKHHCSWTDDELSRMKASINGRSFRQLVNSHLITEENPDD